jgi:hypothetical protein
VPATYSVVLHMSGCCTKWLDLLQPEMLVHCQCASKPGHSQKFYRREPKGRVEEGS